MISGVLPAYAFIGAVLVTGAAVFVFATADPPLPPGAVPPWQWRRFLVMLGQALGTGYLLYFLSDAVHYPDAAAGVAILTAIYAVALIATVVIGGVLSDRTGRRKIFVIASTLVVAVGAIIVTVSQTWTATMVAAAVMGAGFGVYLAVDIALITEVLPAARDRAKDLGVINIANTLPQLMAPVLAAPLIHSVGGYRALFLAATVVTILGAVLVQPIKGVR